MEKVSKSTIKKSVPLSPLERAEQSLRMARQAHGRTQSKLENNLHLHNSSSYYTSLNDVQKRLSDAQTEYDRQLAIANEKTTFEV